MAYVKTKDGYKKATTKSNNSSNSGSSYITYPTANGKTASTSTGSSGTGALASSIKSGGSLLNNITSQWNSGSNNGGGSSYGGSSGGSNKNSQYAAPSLGNTWNANTDYQAIINNAVANGDYVTAAKAEQLRNQKITATGSNYNTTNMYSGHLNNTDYGTMGQQLMANNASWQDVLDIYNSRYNKAVSTEGLQKYANDGIQQMMWQYIVDNMQRSNQQEAQDQYEQWIQGYEQNNPKEEYQSKYDPQKEALLNEILSRDDFSYDAANDPLYQQYANMYRREGDRAMKETMAESAAGAGGMNTYAITAAQQANAYYNSQLNDKIPQLYQLAYDMYLNDKESKVQDLGILQNMDATQYSRYRDTINDYYADKNFAYGVYQDAVNKGQWQSNFDYNSAINNRDFNYNDMWANKEWDANQSWKEKEWESSEDDKQYNRTETARKDAESKMMTFVDLGKMPSDDIIAEAGWDKADVQVLVAAVQAQLAKTGGSGGGGSSRRSGGGNGGYTGKEEEEESGYTGTTKTTNSSTNFNPSASSIWSQESGVLPITETAKNFETTYNACQSMSKNQAKNYLNEVKATGAIDTVQYNFLMNKFGK